MRVTKIQKSLSLKFSIICFLLLSLTCKAQKNNFLISSPDKKVAAQFGISAAKQAFYNVRYQNSPVLANSQLGILMEDADFTKNLSIISASPIVSVKDDYEMAHGKKVKCSYVANKQVFHLKNASGKELDIIFQVSNDGVAFRYYFPEKSVEIKKIKDEITSFHFLPATKAFLQPMSDAKTGWSQVNPCYEEYYKKGIDAGTPSPTKGGWVYPALFNVGKHWILITEAALDKNYCGTRLGQNSPNKEYSIDFPQEQEVFPGGILNPQSALPWLTPWRVITVGSLATITESTLGTDLANAAVSDDQSYIKPGHSSWSWALLKDESVNYNVQKQFIDYAAEMKWEYCLIDVNWDTQIGYDKIQELADYAKTKNVGLILWYNSSGDWNTTKYTPKSKLLTHDDRVKEFNRIKAMGIKGVKIDFFGGDGQSMIQYYFEILEDAAKSNLLVNFHGSTIPRGWHRTYPNLMSMEAIKGFEYVTFQQVNADEEPMHCATLPFTRNASDPMDFTPVSLYKIPKIQRKTTSAFELALSVIFLSGIQHYAETPEGMTHVPPFVKTFLQEIPNQWQDVHFIDGYPGKLVILARKSDQGWYVAGINGENIEKTIEIDLSFIGEGKTGELITDSKEALSFETQKITSAKKVPVHIKGNGGFVVKF